jgi:photosynthetic reaction center cytochrome c subunit
MNRAGLIAIFAALGIFSGTPTFAQIPETYTNLKLLPGDIKRQDLMDTMRGFSKALGVRCHFCHKGEEGQPLSTFDFASDDNKHKPIARTMMTMVGAINTVHLKGLGDPDQPARITCHTCHQGNKVPKRESE